MTTVHANVHRCWAESVPFSTAQKRSKAQKQRGFWAISTYGHCIKDRVLIDPACGSGHFLLAAAEYLAIRLCQIREDSVSTDGYHQAFGEVISHCLYAVDLNPMAVELAKMSLWLEGYESGKPLSFLDSHIQVGNSILGVFDTSILDDGIPNDAYKVLAGDDPSACNECKRTNRTWKSNHQRKSWKVETDQPSLFGNGSTYRDQRAQLERMPEDILAQVDAKKAKYQELQDAFNDQNPEKKAADIYVSTFFVPKDRPEKVPTSVTLERYYRALLCAVTCF